MNVSGFFGNIGGFNKDEQQKMDDNFFDKKIADSSFVFISGKIPSYDFSKDDFSMTDLKSDTFLMAGKFNNLHNDKHRYSLIVYVDEIKIDSFSISLNNDDRAKISISSSSIEYLKIVKKHYYDKYYCYIIDVFDREVVEILKPNESQ